MNKKGALSLILIGLLIVAALGATGYFVRGSLKLSVYDSSEGEFTYTHEYDTEPLLIGNNEFTATPLSYVCGYTGESSLSYPEPRYDCWRSQVSYKGQVYTISGERTVQIDDFMSVTLKPEGRVDFKDGEAYYKRPTSWTSTYHFTVNAPDILVSSFKEYPKQLELGSDQDFTLQIESRLGSFDSDHAGYYQKHVHGLLERGEGWDTIKAALPQGKNNFEIQPDTSELGKVTSYYQPYVIVDADKKVILRQQEPIEIQYEIVLDASSDPEVLEEGGSDNSDIGFFERIWNKIKGWFN